MESLFGLRLLLVEDDAIDARAFQRMLAALNAQIHCDVCATVDAALARWSTGEYELIVTDYRIGDHTALDLLALSEVAPVIVVTGAGDEETAVRLLKAGATDYVVKDLHGQYLRRLPHIMESALNQHRLKVAAAESRLFALALADSALAMSSTLDLNGVLERIIANLRKVVPHDRAGLLLLDNGMLKFQHGVGYSNKHMDTLYSRPIVPNAVELFARVLDERCPIISAHINNVNTTEDPSATYLSVPLMIEGEVIGVLNVERSPEQPFTQDDAQRLQAFAAHAALALHNAHLYHAAQELAAIEERQRLAHDLHDSVTQMLFSASTIAEAAYRLWQRDPASIEHELIDLRDLTQGALSEMRTLLFELKPQSLQNANIAGLIRQLATTFAGRTSLNVVLDLADNVDCPPIVKTALFRITQEALNNIAKHAQASCVRVSLHQKGANVGLIVADDGVGFDPKVLQQTTLGLRIMRERAAKANIELQVTTAPGKGTYITAKWSAIAMTEVKP